MMLGEKLKRLISVFGYNLNASNIIRSIIINVDIGIINKLNVVVKRYVAMNFKNSKRKNLSLANIIRYIKNPPYCR